MKTAELQSGIGADLYLRRVREAVMMEGRNIARREVLLELAAELGDSAPESFDVERFRSDLDGAEARKALEQDIREARFLGIGRFPSLVLRRQGQSPSFLVGWRPYRVLEKEMAAMAPGIGPGRLPATPEAYRTYWRRITDREVEEASGQELMGEFCGSLAPSTSSF